MVRMEDDLQRPLLATPLRNVKGKSLQIIVMMGTKSSTNNMCPDLTSKLGQASPDQKMEPKFHFLTP